jgi:hypothetical protein
MKASVVTLCTVALVFMEAFLMAASATEGIDQLLPAAKEISGWTLDGAPLTYGPDDLWEYIDGSAESFLSYDFQQVLVQDYVSQTGKGIKVEIYELGSPLMAFGIYSQFRSPGLASYEIGNEGFGDEYSVNFWKDRYYVRVAIFEKNPDLHAAAEKFAAAIGGKIVTAGALPPESCAFPEEGICAKETTFLPDNVLGREKFPPAFVASYQFGAETGKLYLSALEDSASARRMFDWYTGETSATVSPTEGPYGSYVRGLGNDQFQGDVLVFQYGKWLGVVTGFSAGSKAGDDLMKRTIEKLATLK